MRERISRAGAMSRPITLICIVVGCLIVAAATATTTGPTRHPCHRLCTDTTRPSECFYEFTLEMYASMGAPCYDCPFTRTDCFRPGCVPAEGRIKALYLVNRQLPGPPIEVCKGDRIVVDVTNTLPTETTSIHFHGLHQHGVPWMDGVPYVTQCPIPPGNVFQYDFVADTPGTYVWHSHSNDQRGDGMFGPLIVRAPPKANPHGVLYDRDEHVMVLTDWTRILGSAAFAIDLHAGSLVRPHTILVNGLGRYEKQRNATGHEFHMPTAVFTVGKGLKYRFRIINAGVQDCPMEMTIDNHTMTVISTDGKDIRPTEIDSLRILSGERYDVVISANQKVDNYWMRFRGKDGSGSACDFTQAHQVSVLRYKGAPEVEPTAEVGYLIPNNENMRQLNPYNKGTETTGAMTVPTLRSVEPNDPTSKAQPDHQYYIAYNYANLDERKKKMLHPKNVEVPAMDTPRTMWQLNHINFKLPPFPLLTQPEMIPPNQFCNVSTAGNCTKEYCSCTHMLSAKLGGVVELVIVDEGTIPINHPVHLHGYHFRVVAMEKLDRTVTVEEVKRLDRDGKIQRNLGAAPLKDTVMVPSGGYTIVRFHADNPGYWLFHCHFEMHADVGMALVFKVGEHEEFPKPPKKFPKCQANVLYPEKRL